MLQAHGMKLLGSGIDDTIWLKFSCKATDPAQIFQTEVVDVSKFYCGFTIDETTDAKAPAAKDRTEGSES